MKKLLALLLAFCLALGFHGTAFAVEAAAQADFIPVTDIVLSYDTFPVDAVNAIVQFSVEPLGATRRNLQVSVLDAGTTGAALTWVDSHQYEYTEYRLQAAAQGTITLRAVVQNGKAEGEDFEKVLTAQIGPGLALAKNFNTLGLFSNLSRKNKLTVENAYGSVYFESSDPNVVTVSNTVYDREGYVTVKASKKVPRSSRPRQAGGKALPSQSKSSPPGTSGRF